MSETERVITIISLINAAIFYAIILVVYFMARKTWLNKALAFQKSVWLAIIGLIALPAYMGSYPFIPTKVRVTCWVLLAVASWWVLIEVYRANWPYGLRLFVIHAARKIVTTPQRVWRAWRDWRAWRTSRR